MAMRNRASLDIEDILRQTELAHYNNGDRRKGFVDLDPLNVTELPPGPVERLAHRWDRSKTEHPRLHSRDAIGDQACATPRPRLSAKSSSARITAAAPLLRP